MRKYLIIVMALLVVFITGCSLTNMDNTPTKQVEKVLNNYKNQDETVVTQLDKIVATDITMTDAQKETYKNILKKQYSNMMYKVKDEIIDGDNATVTVQIEVSDFYKVIIASDEYLLTNASQFNNAEGTYDNSLFIDYKLNKLDKATDKVTYTIDFSVLKLDDLWQVQPLSDADIEKVHGIYAY